MPKCRGRFPVMNLIVINSPSPIFFFKFVLSKKEKWRRLLKKQGGGKQRDIFKDETYKKNLRGISSCEWQKKRLTSSCSSTFFLLFSSASSAASSNFFKWLNICLIYFLFTLTQIALYFIFLPGISYSFVEINEEKGLNLQLVAMVTMRDLCVTRNET